MKTGTFLERVKHNVEKWGRSAGRVEIQYEDARALISAAEALRKHEPDHRALKWLDAGQVIID